jgi:hypothetical protein
VLRGQHRAYQIGLWRGVNLVKVTLVGRLCQELPDALVERTLDHQIGRARNEALMRSLLSDSHFLKIAGALKSM